MPADRFVKRIIYICNKIFLFALKDNINTNY